MIVQLRVSRWKKLSTKKIGEKYKGISQDIIEIDNFTEKRYFK